MYDIWMDNRLRNEKNDTLTLKDIAESLNLSKTTVSRVISGKGRIGEKTRKRVLEYINRNEYRPNPLARGLAVAKTFNIGVTIPDDASRDEVLFFQDCLVAITETISQRDYDPVLVVVSKHQITGLKRITRNHKVDGIIVTRLFVGDEEIPYLKKQGLPFVLIGTTEDKSVYQVDSDQQKGCCEIVEHIINEGCTSIVLLAGDRNFMVNQARYNGYISAFQNNGLAVNTDFVLWNVLAEKKLDAIVKDFLARGVGCFVCMDDVICSRLLSVLDSNGICIPDDVQVASFYDSSNLESYNPPITALHVETRKLGELAGNFLLDLIAGKKMESRRMTEYSVVYRASLK